MKQAAEDPCFVPAHEWKHEGDLTKLRDGEHASATCACGCTVWALVRNGRVQKWRHSGGDLLACPVTGRSKR